MVKIMFLNSFSIKGVEKEVLCSLYSVDGLPRSNKLYWKLKNCANSFGKYLRMYSADYFYEGKPCVLLLGGYERHDPFYVDEVYETKYLKKHVLDLSNKSDQEAFREWFHADFRSNYKDVRDKDIKTEDRRNWGGTSYLRINRTQISRMFSRYKKGMPISCSIH